VYDQVLVKRLFQLVL